MRSKEMKMQVVIGVVILVAYFVILANLPSIMFYISNRDHRRVIRAGAREARKADKIRKKEAKRLMEQMEVGDPIYRTLMRMWNKAGHPSDRNVSRISNWNGTYRIEVNSVDLETGFEIAEPSVMIVSIDLRQPWDRRVIIEAGDHKQWHTVSVGTSHIEYLASTFKIFQA